MALSNAEKTRNRYEAVNRIAVAFAENDSDFRGFALTKGYGGKSKITWRRLETFLKKFMGMSRKPGEFDRYEALNLIAKKFAEMFDDFRKFAEETGDEITWRKLETFLKHMEPEQAADLLEKVIESSEDGGK